MKTWVSPHFFLVMISASFPQEPKQQFLQKIADQYGFFGDTREVFIARFSFKKGDSKRSNVLLATLIPWNPEKIPEDPVQKLQDELARIFDTLEEDGCPIARKRGRSKKGENPWEQAYQWLWETKFPEWQQEQKATDSTFPENPQNIPRSGVKKFVGREKELQRLHDQLQSVDRVAISAIAGMGGVGKTELAIQYATQYQAVYPSGICWVFARELNVGTQIVGFAQSQLSLEIPDGLELADQVAFCWRNWLPEQVLVVLDDVKNYEDIKPYLPPQDSRFKVLMTTRIKFGPPIRLLSLEVLSLDASLELLKSLIGEERIEQEREVASSLCTWLEYLPLALELVGRYLVEEEDLSLENVLFRLQEKAEQRQALELEEMQIDPDAFRTSTAKRGVAAAFELSWEVLDEKSQHLGKLLSLFALAPIPWSLVEATKQRHCKMYPEVGEFNPDGLRAARRELRRLHLLQDLDPKTYRLQDPKTYRLHSLIREFFRSKLEGLEYVAAG